MKMNDKKQIGEITREMAKEICSQTMTEYCVSGKCENQFYCQVNYSALETLYNAGYRKLDDHAIMVLRKAKGLEERIRKETAKEILQELYTWLWSKKSEYGFMTMLKSEFLCKLREIIGQYGVEIGE